MLELILAIGAVILIDVLLGGENAIVIAMAVNQLPPHMRKKAMIWGTVGAIGARFLCVAMLTYLLMVPGLRFTGGVAIAYIAWKLCQPQEDEDLSIKPVSTFWRAIITIMVADVSMGLDNALGIAAVANGNWWVIIFGLMVSVPIILIGATVISKAIRRWPKIVYLGSAILAVVAVKLIISEPLLQRLF
jgi:hypothetical protein